VIDAPPGSARSSVSERGEASCRVPAVTAARTIAALALLLALSPCVAAAQAAPADAGARRAAVHDAGTRAAVRDAGARDAGPRRVLAHDAGPREIAPRRAAVRDAGVRDAGPFDAGLVDAGAPEPVDAGAIAAVPSEDVEAPPQEDSEPERLAPLGGHAVFVLLVQLALLLIAARLGSELSKRVGLPAVVGELAAGIVLGPTIFGHYWPAGFDVVFPYESAQFHLLEVVGELGMVLLLLLTGLETDLRLLKNLGRAALIASATGMVIPFASGFLLGMVLPDAYLAEPDRRILFSLFLATAMAISAMPVIAKILMDLDLARRNIGIVILSAGVVDDTAGWLILSMIAGAASHGNVEVGQLLLTLGLTLLFLVLAAFVLYPVLRVAMRFATERFKSPETDLVLIFVVTMLCAAATEWIGVHAVFGAFICGTVLRQVPRVRQETVHKLESLTFQIFAPVFFGIVGLKVDLWTLAGGGEMVLVIVLIVACFGKLFGCTIGSLWGGLRFWEALSIAVAMNARGAMGLVCASIGLSLGILNPQMFSIIVVVAIVTSFMAPVLLRLTVRRVRMTEEEARRILAQQTRGVIDPERVRILLPAGDNPNAVAAAELARGLAKGSESPVEIFHVDVTTTWWQRVMRTLRRSKQDEFDRRLAQVEKQLAGTKSSLRRVPGRDVVRSVLEEAQKGFDVIVLGASADASGPKLTGDVLEHVVADAPCHVAIVRAGDEQAPFTRLFVPFDGSLVGRVATEFALRYAEATGASLTVGLIAERPLGLPKQDSSPDAMSLSPDAMSISDSIPLEDARTPRRTPEEELERISPIFKTTSVKPTIEQLEHGTSIAGTVGTGGHDLVVLGAENRAVQHRLFFGHETERLIRQAGVGLVVVVPRLTHAASSDH
jgi:Kef-type K+ transport system membrane component KefB/nucleotide-binding universal stress UspA family protein